MPAVNFTKIQQGLNLAPQSGSPSSPSNGDMYYNSSTNKFQFYQNGSFQVIGTGDLLANGTVPLTANWNVGAFNLTAAAFIPSGSTVPVNGMYLSAANTVAFASNTTLAGSIDSSQKWTIGASGGTQTHVVNGKIQVGAAIGGNNSINASSSSIYSLWINQADTTNTAPGMVVVVGQTTASGGTANALAVYNNAGGSAGDLIFNVTGAGAVQIGQASGTKTHLLYGNLTASTGQTFLGTTAALIGLETLDVSRDPASNALSIAASIWGQNTLNGAVSSQIIGVDAEIQRTITTSQTDTGVWSGLFNRIRVVVPTSNTLTNTASLQGVRCGTVSISGGGSLAATNIYKVGIDADSGAHGTTKIGVFIGNQTGNTNNAAIADNNAFTGTYFINSTQTNESLISGDLRINTEGKGLLIKEGTNAKMGASTLVLGTVTVSTTAVTANSRIFLSVQSLGTVAVATPVAVTARTAATSFVITSSSAVDTSVIAWMIVEPA